MVKKIYSHTPFPVEVRQDIENKFTEWFLQEDSDIRVRTIRLLTQSEHFLSYSFSVSCLDEVNDFPHFQLGLNIYRDHGGELFIEAVPSSVDKVVVLKKHEDDNGSYTMPIFSLDNIIVEWFNLSLEILRGFALRDIYENEDEEEVEEASL